MQGRHAPMKSYRWFLALILLKCLKPIEIKRSRSEMIGNDRNWSDLIEIDRNRSDLIGFDERLTPKIFDLKRSFVAIRRSYRILIRQSYRWNWPASIVDRSVSIHRSYRKNSAQQWTGKVWWIAFLQTDRSFVIRRSYRKNWASRWSKSIRSSTGVTGQKQTPELQTNRKNHPPEL